MAGKTLFVRIGAPVLSVLFSLWAGLKFMMDWIGRSTIAEDSAQAASLLEKGANWLFSTPWYVPALLATALTAVTVWLLLWPAPSRQEPARQEGDPPPAPVSQVRAMPLLHFGSPRQVATEPGFSWWHIPVTLVGEDGPDHIPNCAVSMRYAPGSLIGVPSVLGWKSDEPNGSAEMTLVRRRERLVPIACRREPAGEERSTRAILTDKSYLKTGAKRQFGGHVEFKLVVTWGGGEEQSLHYYRIKVPDRGSNGHFVVEVVPVGEIEARTPGHHLRIPFGPFFFP